MTEVEEIVESEIGNGLTVLRYAYSYGKSYFITPDKYCPFKGSFLVLILACEYTTEKVSLNKTPCVGNVCTDINGNRLKIIEATNPKH